MADRKLVVKVVGDSSALERAFKRSSNAAQGFGRTLGGALGGLARGAIFAGGAAAIGGLAVVLHEGTQEFIEHQKVAAQTGAVLRSTGLAAGVTQKQIESLALSLSNLSGIDDEVVQAGENVLLSFTNIRNSAGVGNDIFTQATKAAVDFAARTGRDVPQAALLFGKALEDPAKRLTSLARAGVVFSASQIKTVTALQKSGDLMGAQKLVLAELEKRYGGAAKAAGDTLPGKLQILRERFKDLSGELIGAVAPAFTTVITSITNFVKKLSEAQGGRAKFNLVVDGIKGFGKKVFTAIEDELRSIDFAKVADVLQQKFVSIATSTGARIQSAFRSIDWAKVGREIIDGFGRIGEIASRVDLAALNKITDVVNQIDFKKVGKALIDGFAAAVVAVGNFLIHLNWGAIWGASIKLAVAVIKGLGSLLVGAGVELGRALLSGIGTGLRDLGGALKKQALKIALDIVEPFSHIPSAGGKWARDLKDKWNKELDEIAAHAKVTAQAIEGALGVKASEHARTLRGAQAGDAQTRPAPAAKPKPSPTTRTTTDVKETTTAVGGLSKAVEKLLAKLQLGVDKAGLTKTLKDDLAANAKLIAALTKQVKLHKDNLDLQRQLVSAQQAQAALVEQQNQAEKDARQARQFKALGLGATGDDIIPGVGNLKKQSASLISRLQASGGLTTKLKALFAGVGKVLSGSLGKVTKETREKIAELFQTIRDGFDKGATPLTGTLKKSFKDVFGDVSGLTADQIRTFRADFSRVTQVGAGPSVAAAGAGGLTVTVKAPDVFLDGKRVSDATRRHNQIRTRRNPPQKRGPQAGHR